MQDTKTEWAFTWIIIVVGIIVIGVFQDLLFLHIENTKFLLQGSNFVHICTYITCICTFVLKAQ